MEDEEHEGEYDDLPRRRRLSWFAVLVIAALAFALVATVIWVVVWLLSG